MLAALLKASVTLVLQFDWHENAGSLELSELKTAVIPPLLGLAHYIGNAAQMDALPVNEAVTLIHSLIQVIYSPS